VKLSKPSQKPASKLLAKKASHLILIKNEYIVPVPKHQKIKRGLLLEIIAEANLTKEEFLKLLKEI